MLICRNLLDVMERNINFVNGNVTYCQISNTFNWFNSTDLVPLEQMKKFLDVRFLYSLHPAGFWLK